MSPLEFLAAECPHRYKIFHPLIPLITAVISTKAGKPYKRGMVYRGNTVSRNNISSLGLLTKYWVEKSSATEDGSTRGRWLFMPSIWERHRTKIYKNTDNLIKLPSKFMVTNSISYRSIKAVGLMYLI
jgi:hypothetical protein